MRIARVVIALLFVFSFFAASSAQAVGKDWPTYRCDITRRAVTTETIGPQLFLQWRHIPGHAPDLAWPKPAEAMPRMHSDTAYHVAAVEDSVYFGSCVPNKVHSIDVNSLDE